MPHYVAVLIDARVFHAEGPQLLDQHIYTPVPKENCSECAKDQITFFVFVPPYMEIERRRKLIKVLDEAANKAVGYRGELKNIVIFKYHDDEACGVDGVLRADAKAAAEK